jgi:hypothetical protein
VIFLLNGALNGASAATVTGVSGGANAVIGLSDGTSIRLLGVSATSVGSVTFSSGIVAIT